MGETKILVVEDDVSVSEFLSDLLEMSGFRSIEWARNGQEGVEKYLLMRANIVLMDVDMPVMNGYEASKSIKSMDPEANIILMTGRPDSHWAISTLEEGYATTLLSKPFDFHELFGAIDRILNNGASFLSPHESLGMTG